MLRGILRGTKSEGRTDASPRKRYFFQVRKIPKIDPKLDGPRCKNLLDGFEKFLHKTYLELRAEHDFDGFSF